MDATVSKETALRTLIIQNLPTGASEHDLKTCLYMLLSRYGVVISLNAGHPLKGYAFGAFGHSDSARTAKEALDGREFMGRVISVSFASRDSKRVQNFAAYPDHRANLSEP